jgi:transcriptional regulator with XRE-family HTH domain
MINSGQSYIYRIEAGRVKVGVDKLIRIADALDVDVKDLINF